MTLEGYMKGSLKCTQLPFRYFHFRSKPCSHHQIVFCSLPLHSCYQMFFHALPVHFQKFLWLWQSFRKSLWKSFFSSSSNHPKNHSKISDEDSAVCSSEDPSSEPPSDHSENHSKNSYEDSEVHSKILSENSSKNSPENLAENLSDDQDTRNVYWESPSATISAINQIADLLGPDGWLKLEEWQCHIDNGLCLHCGEFGHIVSNFPL